mgnify:CR=1 FL=1
MIDRGERAAYDAIVLSGGRGSRLGGVDKGALVVGGRSLLDTALEACRGSRRTVVVGPVPAGKDVVTTRESPAYGGPAAAVVAGLQALRAVCDEAGEPAAPLTLLLACDLPGAEAGVPLLLAGLRQDPEGDGWCLAEADGRLQWLFAIYRTAALEEAAAELGEARDVSMGRLLRPLRLRGIPAPESVTADVDTPEDAARWRG